jgi:fluoride exporter
MHKLAWIALGGLLGTLCRYAMSSWVDERSHSQFPYGTMAVNLMGCFVAGLLFPLLEQATISPELRLAVFTGFLGGFTTFSAYGLQTAVLASGGMMSMAAMNVFLSNIAGLAMVWLGGTIARAFFLS